MQRYLTQYICFNSAAEPLQTTKPNPFPLKLLQIFNVILHCRLWLLVLQSMAHLFFLWALRHYYGPCLSLLLLTLTPLAELVLRFLYLCNHAEALSRAVR